MAERTGIAWTDATFNPWWGCQKVSPGCDHCYAEALDRRIGGAHWGPHAERRRTSPANWRGPLAWDRAAAKAGQRRRVFCASMADVFDNQVPPEWRADLWALIRMTPWLQWQLLTKRAQNIRGMLPPDWGHGFHNVWLGTTAENQTEADRRIPHLLAAPATVRFLSCEPLIGPVDLRAVYGGQTMTDALEGMSEWPVVDRGDRMVAINPSYRRHAGIDWVIIGGESGAGARPMQREWADSLMRQCRDAGVPAFFKQVGSRRGPDWPAAITGKGDDPSQWPDGFRQEFPPREDR